MTIFLVDDENAYICESFEVLYLDEITGEIQTGFASEGEGHMTDADAIIAVGLVLSAHCPDMLDLFFDEMGDQFSTSTIDDVVSITEALEADADTGNDAV